MSGHVGMSDLSPPTQRGYARVQDNRKSGSLTPLFVLLAAALLAGLGVMAYGQYRLLHQHSPHGPSDPEGRAHWLMSRFPLIDGHNDLAWQYRKMRDGRVWSSPTFDLTTDCAAAGLQTDIPRLREGRVGGQFWSVFVLCGMPDAVRATIEEIDIVRSFVAKHSDTFQLALTADDVEAAFAQGRIASLMGMEGGHSIDGSMAALRQFYQMGVRYLSLTHNCNNAWAESCCDDTNWTPASAFNVTGLTNTTGVNGPLFNGLQVIREMNRLGMIVDLSHVSTQTMLDALHITEAPVMFSHSGVRALVPHQRNVPDEVIRLLAANDGVQMIPFISQFIVNATDPLAYSTAARVVDHMDYVRNLTGTTRHLGIGADFEGDDGPENFPVDLGNVSKYPVLIAEMLRRGYSDEDVVAIMGGNILRVMRAVEQSARTIAASAQPHQQENRITAEYACRSDF